MSWNHKGTAIYLRVLRTNVTGTYAVSVSPSHQHKNSVLNDALS
jgi:hypothetical protein